MAKHKRAAPGMRDGAGIEGSALVGVGKEAVSTNQCRKWLRGKKVLAKPNSKGVNHKTHNHYTARVGLSPVLVGHKEMGSR